MSSRRWLLLAGSALTLAVYGLRLNRVAGLYVDDAWYVLLGQAIASGQGYHLINAPTPAMAAILPAFPPGFPLALALVTTLTSAFPANVLYLKLVSVVAMFGVGALAAAYYRHRGVPASLASGLALAVVLTPAFVWLATSTVMSEPLFTLALPAPSCSSPHNDPSGVVGPRRSRRSFDPQDCRSSRPSRSGTRCDATGARRHASSSRPSSCCCRG